MLEMQSKAQRLIFQLSFH